jgi:hypothetical protein
VIERTLGSTPKDATHGSIRSMATQTGLSHTTIRRIWKAFGLQPHRSETFRLSSDPLFVDKVRDIVGLYLSPPHRALGLSVDEKSQKQALDREQPVLPMMPGIPERRTHSYVRHGTTSLFAALDIASGFVLGKCYKRHRGCRGAASTFRALKEVFGEHGLPHTLNGFRPAHLTCQKDQIYRQILRYLNRTYRLLPTGWQAASGAKRIVGLISGPAVSFARNSVIRKRRPNGVRGRLRHRFKTLCLRPCA